MSTRTSLLTIVLAWCDRERLTFTCWRSTEREGTDATGVPTFDVMQYNNTAVHFFHVYYCNNVTGPATTVVRVISCPTPSPRDSPPLLRPRVRPRGSSDAPRHPRSDCSAETSPAASTVAAGRS